MTTACNVGFCYVDYRLRGLNCILGMTLEYFRYSSRQGVYRPPPSGRARKVILIQNLTSHGRQFGERFCMRMSLQVRPLGGDTLPGEATL